MARIHAAAFGDARPWDKSEFATLLKNGAFACGDARGFALVRVVLDEAELLTIATHPDHRRKGLARTNMRLWRGEARKRGATRVFLEVAADNDAAIRLYLAWGFSINGRRPGYYRRGDGRKCDALMMASPLANPLARPPS